MNDQNQTAQAAEPPTKYLVLEVLAYVALLTMLLALIGG